MDDKKNPHPWRAWILTALIVSQILTAIQIRQANQELWNAVIQLGDRLSDHLEYEIRHNEEMNHLAEEENRLLEEWYQKLEEFLNQIPVARK